MEQTRRRFLINTSGGALTAFTGCTAQDDELSPLSKESKLPRNAIFIISDTFRADYLGCYGNKWIQTPHLDRLAKESVLFTQCYADGLPTIPARRAFLTGRSVLPERLWQPLEANEHTLAEHLTQHKYLTGLISDVYHYFLPGMNFHRGFRSFQWIRGQEEDLWKAGPRDLETHGHIPEHHWTERYHFVMLQYLMNTRHWQNEEDYFCSQIIDTAIQWLKDRCCNQPFFLVLDCYDPHEPWDAPVRFQQLYRKTYPLERYLFGYGVNWNDIREEDIPVLRDLYAAEVSYVDHCIGKLLGWLRDTHLLDDTLIVFTSDHGTHLGEQGCVQKRPGLLTSSITRIPFMIRHPDRRYEGRQIDQLVSAIDIAPTILALLGVPPLKEAEGLNLWPFIENQSSHIRESVYTGFFSFASVRHEEWLYFQHFKGEQKGFGPCLYHLVDDPKETTNKLDRYPEVVRAMRQKIERRFKTSLPLI